MTASDWVLPHRSDSSNGWSSPKPAICLPLGQITDCKGIVPIDASPKTSASKADDH